MKYINEWINELDQLNVNYSFEKGYVSRENVPDGVQKKKNPTWSYLFESKWTSEYSPSAGHKHRIIWVTSGRESGI